MTGRTTGQTSTNAKENTVPALPNLNRAALAVACRPANLMVVNLAVFLIVIASIYGWGWFVLDGVMLLLFAAAVAVSEYRGEVREQRYNAEHRARYEALLEETARLTAELDAAAEVDQGKHHRPATA